MANSAFADRIKETTASAWAGGTGSLTLSGTAPTGYKTFANGFTAGASTYVTYCVSNASTGQWETGQGRLTAATTLTRDVIFANSLNTTAKISFPSGTGNDVFCTSPASTLVSINPQTGDVIIPGGNIGLTVAPTLVSGTPPPYMTITLPQPTTTNGDGAPLDISGGNSTGTGLGGYCGVAGGSAVGSGFGGDVLINGGSADSGNSGGVQISSGATNTGSAGGVDILLCGGIAPAISMVPSAAGSSPVAKIGFYGSTPVVRPTTATTAATFVVNTGTTVNTGSTFGGYTIQQIVKALQNLGLLT